MKKVAIIIVNYNGIKYLPDLLGSIFDYKPSSVNQEVILVDNNSVDDSVSLVKEYFTQVKILEQGKNLGFAKGNNIGMQYAIDHDFDYVMLLNQDTIVTQGYLDLLVNKIESDIKIAAVQPRLMLHPQTDLINSLGNVIHFLGFGYTFGHRQKIQDTLRQTQGGARYKIQEINYCSGAACLLKVKILKEVGLFDEDLFMYHEDLDLGWRFRLMGYQNTIVLDSVVYHKYEFSRSIKKYYFMERNRFIVIFKNYKIGTLILILPTLIIMEAGLFLFSFTNGWWKEKLKVYAYFLNPINWVKILKKRKFVQSLRIVSDQQIVSDFSGKIEHQEVDSLVVKAINPFFNTYWQIVKRMIIW